MRNDVPQRDSAPKSTVFKEYDGCFIKKTMLTDIAMALGLCCKIAGQREGQQPTKHVPAYVNKIAQIPTVRARCCVIMSSSRRGMVFHTLQANSTQLSYTWDISRRALDGTREQ